MHYPSITLKQRSDIHIARKLWHVLGVLAIAAIHQLVSKDVALKLLALISFVAVSVDVLRQRLSPLNGLALRLFGPLMRENERHGLAGTTYLLIGTFLIEIFYQKAIVTLSLLFLAIADPLASYVGIRYGKDRLIRSKSLQGTVAAFAACTVISAAYLFYFQLMVERLLMASLIAGLIGAVSELLPIGKLDDNFTFPVVSGTLLWMMFLLFGGI